MKNPKKLSQDTFISEIKQAISAGRSFVMFTVYMAKTYGYSNGYWEVRYLELIRDLTEEAYQDFRFPKSILTQSMRREMRA